MFPSAKTTIREGDSELIVILHGLNRTPRAMEKMAVSLAGEGYTVVNLRYRSTDAKIEILADEVWDAIEPRVSRAEKFHIVTHSMGGIVARAMLEKNAPTNLSRVVMLAPPNQGSEVTDKLSPWRLYRWVNGPAGDELGTSENSIFNRLGPPTYEVGIIAGNRTVNPFFSWLIPGPDDGKVAVERTRLDGMSDFICLPVTHTWIMRNPSVIGQTRHFLRAGGFQKKEVN